MTDLEWRVRRLERRLWDQWRLIGLLIFSHSFLAAYVLIYL